MCFTFLSSALPALFTFAIFTEITKKNEKIARRGRKENLKWVNIYFGHSMRFLLCWGLGAGHLPSVPTRNPSSQESKIFSPELFICIHSRAPKKTFNTKMFPSSDADNHENTKSRAGREICYFKCWFHWLNHCWTHFHINPAEQSSPTPTLMEKHFSIRIRFSLFFFGFSCFYLYIRKAFSLHHLESWAGKM